MHPASNSNPATTATTIPPMAPPDNPGYVKVDANLESHIRIQENME